MKIVTIGDIHGKTDWKAPVFGHDPSTNTGSKTTIDDYDKVVFEGDYVDAFDVDNAIMKHNLLEIIDLKKKYPDKVTLLAGNHDLQYMFGYQRHGCSGYRPEMAVDFGDIFKTNKTLFQASWEYENYLWTHAGVHVGWYKFRLLPAIKDMGIDELTLAQKLNHLFDEENPVLFDVGYTRGGRFDVGGPFWVDKSKVMYKPVEGYNQIVGHSKVREILKFEYKNNNSITFVDVLDSKPCTVYTLDL